MILNFSDSDYSSNHQRSMCKKSFKAFDFIHREKKEQILLAYDFPKETVTAIMRFSKDMKAIVCSPDDDTDFFDSVTGVLQGDTMAHILLIICQDYVLLLSTDLMKENGFTLNKGKKQKLLLMQTIQMI